MPHPSYRRTLIASSIVALLASQPIAAATARQMYAAALARERALRSALTGSGPTTPTLAHLRDVVAGYEALARRYPTSGYSDNALWQAAWLASDAFDRFGNAQDRRTSVRLLDALVAKYPTSSLHPKAQAQLAEWKGGDAKPTPPLPMKAAESLPAQPGPDHAPSPASSSVPTPSGRAVLRQIRRVVLPDTVRVTVEFDAETHFHEEMLANPARVFMDFEDSRAAPPLVDAVLTFDTDVVRQVRVGRHPNHTTRVVIDLEGVTKYSVFTLHNPYRVVVDCQRPPARAALPPRSQPRAPSSSGRSADPIATLLTARSAAPTTPTAPPPAPTPAVIPAPVPPVLRATMVPRRPVILTAPATPTPTSIDHAAAGEASAAEHAAEPSPPARLVASKRALPNVVSAPAPPTSSARSGLSMARQLGLGVARVVIDPGHGGHDPGATAQGVTEAELTLDIALRLEKLLAKQAGVETVLTRRTDDYVPLEERTSIATREGADLFLSIHVNANHVSTVQGVETYLLNFASNADAAAVAARENSASGRTMNSLPDIVKAITLNNKVDESRDLATVVQASMVKRLRPLNKSLRDLGVRQAPFVVLLGASMPSVLVEVAFLTNRQEARLLKSANYKQRIAEALADAVVRYQRSLKNVQTIAHQ